MTKKEFMHKITYAEDFLGDERILNLFYKYADKFLIYDCYEKFCKTFDVEFYHLKNKDDMIKEMDYKCPKNIDLHQVLMSHLSCLPKSEYDSFIEYIGEYTKI